MKDKKSNKKSNARIYITFIIVLVILYNVGYVAGTLVGKAEKNGDLDTMLATLKNNLIFVIHLFTNSKGFRNFISFKFCYDKRNIICVVSHN